MPNIALVGMNYKVKGEEQERRVEIGEEVTGLSDKEIAELPDGWVKVEESKGKK